MRAFKRSAGLLVLLVLLAIPVFAVANLQALGDWWRLRDYVPPPEIAKLAADGRMTENGRRLFYVTHPRLISDKAEFNAQCPLSEQTIVLGCYYHYENSLHDGIALYDVTDQRLAGVEEVTAAHEMLHSAYQRLSSEEKTRVDNLLVNFYNNGLNDDRVEATIDSYRKTEPNDLVNEMHSVFATEIAELPAELEEYYKKYFDDRRVITNFSNQYKSVFAQNKAQLDSIKNQIDNLKNELSQSREIIEDEQEALLDESRRMQGLISSGNTAQYNAAVGPYNARVQKLRNLTADFNAKVNQVNKLVEQYNDLAYAQEDLYKALDSRIPTQTTQ